MDVKLLKEICEIPGAPGFERPIRNFVMTRIKKHVDDLYIDNVGNLVAIKKGTGATNKKVLVAAHMDEIGFIVTHIDDEGFVKFHTLGGFDPKTLTAQRVIIHGKKDLVGVMGTKPIHVLTSEERNKVPKISDFFIDLGMPPKEVEKWVSVGDPVTRERELIEMGDCVNCKSLDNRVSVYVLIESLKKIKKPPVDVYAVFTVQEELGMRGASVTAHQINPDFGITLDTTIAFDVPGAQPHERVTALGKGAAIKIMDASVVCDGRMVAFLKETARKNKIPWQPEILTAGGTDTAQIQRMGKDGSISGAISIPTRHIHQVIEMANKKDIDHAVQLLVKSIEGLATWNWIH